MKRTTKNSGLYVFLESHKEFETGSYTDIERLKKEYWNGVRKEWMKSKREHSHSYTLLLNDKQNRIIEEFAKRHHKSKTRFLLIAALSYCEKRYIVPDEQIVSELLLRLNAVYNLLNRLMEDEQNQQFRSQVLEIVQGLEREIVIQFKYPKSV